MKKPAAAMTLALLALAGCTSAPEKDASYESINDLAAAYGDALDVECRENDSDIHDNGWIQAQCGPQAVLMMFTSDAKRDEILAKNPLEVGERWVQGPNWVIAAPQYEAEKAQASLGGVLLD